MLYWPFSSRQPLKNSFNPWCAFHTYKLSGNLLSWAFCWHHKFELKMAALAWTDNQATERKTFVSFGSMSIACLVTEQSALRSSKIIQHLTSRKARTLSGLYFSLHSPLFRFVSNVKHSTVSKLESEDGRISCFIPVYYCMLRSVSRHFAFLMDVFGINWSDGITCSGQIFMNGIFIGCC